MSFTVDQTVIDAVVSHLQAQGLTARVLANGLIEIEPEANRLLHWDPFMFMGVSPEIAIKQADYMLNEAKQ